MSQDLKLKALELAVAAAPTLGGADIVTVADKFYYFLTVTGAVAKAEKPAKPAAKETATKAEGAPVAAAEVVKEAAKEPAKPTITHDQIKGAVIKLVEAGNTIAAAGGDASGKVGRGYAAAVLQPFGATNVSTVPVDKYPEVLAALEAKLAAVQEEAALTG